MEAKVGMKIKIVSMTGEPQYTGKTGFVTIIDDAGQLHGDWGGCAVNPAIDKFEVVCPVHFSTHNGKMEGIRSISTNTLLNKHCRANARIPGSICEKCFAEQYLSFRDYLDAATANNQKVLTSRVLETEELPVIEDEIFRFESFGDLNNETQLINYINIVKHNPKTRFTLWTKRCEIAYNYFSTHDVPENFTLIISSLMVNTRQNLDKFKALGKFAKGQLKVFTVYNKEYIAAHVDSLDINCGSRCCAGCRNCYDKNEIEEINEVLKEDQAEVQALLDYNNPQKRKEFSKFLDYIEDLDI